MFRVADLDRLAVLRDPQVPRLIGLYYTLDGYALVFEWFDGLRFASVEPLGIVVSLPPSRGVPKGRYVA